MSVYIKGMEMPTEGFVEILIRDDGAVLRTGQSYRIDGNDYYTPYVGEMPVIYTAVPVPDHGDLIDRQAFRLEMDKHYPFDKATQSRHGIEDNLKSAVLRMLFDAPTIIPASGGTNNE